MGIDWTDQFDATHCDVDTQCFYKKVDGVWMLHMDGNEWDESVSLVNGEVDPERMVAR